MKTAGMRTHEKCQLKGFKTKATFADSQYSLDLAWHNEMQRESVCMGVF